MAACMTWTLTRAHVWNDMGYKTTASMADGNKSIATFKSYCPQKEHFIVKWYLHDHRDANNPAAINIPEPCNLPVPKTHDRVQSITHNTKDIIYSYTERSALQKKFNTALRIHAAPKTTRIIKPRSTLGREKLQTNYITSQSPRQPSNLTTSSKAGGTSWTSSSQTYRQRTGR